MTIEEIQVPNDDDARRTSPLETIRREIFDADPEVELAAFITGAKDRGFELLSATAVQFTPGTRGYVALYRVLAVVLALLVVAAPVFAQKAAPNAQVCSVGYFSGSSINVYVCATTGTYTNSSGYAFPVTVPVSKPWFQAHCTKKGANKAPGYDTVAVCDAYAVADPTLTVKAAAGPSKFKQRLEMVAVVGVGTLIIAACVAGGGCGALGGS